MVVVPPPDRIEFVDRQLARFAENLDPEGREYLLGIIRASDHARSHAAATRKRERDELIRALARQIAPGGSANLACGKMRKSAAEYMRRRYREDVMQHRRPLCEPERTIYRILELNSGNFPSDRTIRSILA